MASIGFVMDNLARAGNQRDLRELEARRTAVQEGQLGLQEQQLGIQKNADLMKRYQDNLSKTIDTASKLVQASDAQGKGRSPQVLSAIEAMREDAIRTARVMSASGLPVDHNLISAQFEAVIQSRPPGQVVQQEASRAGAIKTAELQAGEPFQKVASKPFFSPGLNRRFQAFDDGRGNLFMVKDGQQIPVPEDAFQVSSQVTGTSKDVLSPQEKRSFRQELESAEFNLDAMARTLEDVIKTPGATGFRASLSNWMGGKVGQLPIIGRDAEKAVVNFISNADPEEVAAISTRSRINVARMLSFITGEESGRFTEAERQIAETTLKGLDPNASPAQIMGATKTVMEILIDDAQRNRKSLKLDPVYDLSTDEGVNDFGNWLLDLGYSEDEAAELIQRRR